jgi:Tol biopolymer transport system component/tRNA A-37 threonylcarbamoyl transferase component Bud32
VTLVAGTKLGRYEIRSKIGEGGMGEVYRARDTKLNRDVAIKVLPATLSQNTDRLRRFEQEAQAAGALNHPNILAVYDVGTHDGAPYVVSELLEGESLKERLGDGPLAQRKTIDYAVQVAHGLAAAHGKGIVHRDLKPDNLFITRDDRIKILDFGLAKLVEPVKEGVAQTEIATRKVQTDPGTVMGTVGYMSPEQVRGRHVDHRSDIFSFGAVLYEMLCGQRAFHGDSAVETLNAILKEEPPELTTTNRNIAPALERVVWHCLEKSLERRFQSATDVAFALEALSGSSPVSSQTLTAIAAFPARSRIGKHLPWIVAGFLLIALLAMLPFAIAYFRGAPARAKAIRAAILPPENANFTALNVFAVSPDGVRLAFVARDAKGQAMLWMRPLDALTAQPLAGTDGISPASPPFWSPDSQFIGFFAGGKLKKIDASGGPPQTLCDAANPRGGTWNRDGVIIFTPNSTGPLHRVSAAGGASTAVTKLDESRRQSTHRWPYFLPDGHHFVYRVGSSGSTVLNENNGVYLGSLESQEQRLILRTDTSVAYVSGHLLFAREGTLMAQPFDEKSLQLTGDAFPIAEHLQFDVAGTRAIFSVSENGVLAFQSGTARGNNRLIWFDRSGKQTGQIGEPGFYAQPRLSPDGQKLAVIIFDTQAGSTDIWLYELARNVPTRFTFDPAFDTNPIWSPDGSQVAFTSNRKGPYDIYQKASSGAGSEEVLFESNEGKNTTSWSADGRFIAFHNADTKANTKLDIWILPLFGERKPFPFLQTQFNESNAQFSPDGHWIAYVSDESSSNQVYIAPFPGPGGKWQASRAGGSELRWRGDGKELFFLAPDNKLMAVEVNAKESTLEIGNAEPLFEVHPATNPGTHYDATRDGKRFLVCSAGEGSSAPITLVVNWTADLKK